MFRKKVKTTRPLKIESHDSPVIISMRDARRYPLGGGRFVVAAPVVSDHSGPVASHNRRITDDDKPIWYVFVDESGVPFYRENESTMIMSGVLTDDPEALAALILKQYSETYDAKAKKTKDREFWSEPGTAEVKHETTTSDIHNNVMEGMKSLGVRGFTVVVRKNLSDADGLEPKEFYESTFSDFVRLLKDEGPEGFYRIRVDDSKWFDRKEYDKMASGILKGSGRRLTKFNGVTSVDSDLTPAMQAADIFVGEERRVLGKKCEDTFNDRYKVRRRTGSKKVRRIGK